MCQITSTPLGNKHPRCSYQNAWSNLDETHRGPLPDQYPPTLKTANPSVAQSKCAKSHLEPSRATLGAPPLQAWESRAAKPLSQPCLKMKKMVPGSSLESLPSGTWGRLPGPQVNFPSKNQSGGISLPS